MKNRWMILLVVIALLMAGLACGSSDDEDKQVRTLVEPTAEKIIEEGEVGEPSEPTEEPTAIPLTATPEIEGLMKEGTHLVGIDIEPGIYVGLAGDDILSSCYWVRLSGLSGEFDDLIANDNSVGLYYVEILPSDKAFKTACEMLPIYVVPAPGAFLTVLTVGTYIIGRDIEAGIYRGEAGDDFLESCYWERQSCVSGEFDCIIANDNATGQFFVEVLPSDFSLKVGCNVEKID